MASNLNAERFLPVPPLWFGALLAISGGANHGYGIIKELEARAVGGKRPAAGTIYIALQRLLDEGLVVEQDPGPASDRDGRKKRQYELTPLGRRVTALEASRMRELVSISEARRLLPAE